MDYKEKYEQALERAKGLYKQGMMPERIEYIFPELKESDDEKMRAWLIEYFDKVNDEISKDDRKKIIAWLEKQGEQKPAWSEEDEEMIKGLNNCISELEEKCGWRYTYVNDKDVELDKIRNWLKSFKERYSLRAVLLTPEEIKKICAIYDNLKQERECATVLYNSDETFFNHVLMEYKAIASPKQ